jgi:hypothetical protein
VSTTEAFQSGSFGFKLIGTTVADGSSRVEELVPEGELELETTGGGAETANGTVESRRATVPQERLIIFIDSSSSNLKLYMQNWGLEYTPYDRTS